jgi:hypothetical protein
LVKESERLHVAVPRGPDVTKKIRQQTLFTAILAKQTLYTEENDNAQPQEKSVGEKAKSTDVYYLKGNWVSWVTNCKGCIKEHGSIRDSW